MDEQDIPKTKSQEETERKLAQGQEESDANSDADNGPSYYTGESDDKDSGAASKAAEAGTAKGVAKLATSTTPVGRVAGLALGVFNFLKSNKKASITGGAILGTLISVVMLLGSLLPATQLVWMGAIFNDFNFGPHNRNVVNRSERIRSRVGDLRNNDTRMGQQADAIASDDSRVNRMQDIPDQNLERTNQRNKFRANIQRKINTARPQSVERFRWRFFTGDSADSDGFRSPKKRLRGTDDGRRRASLDGPEQYQEAADDTRNSDGPSRAARSHARQIARGSLIGASIAVGCASAMVADVIPDEKERYEILMGRAGNFYTAGSQLGAGEDVHGDEVSDTMSAFQDTEQTLESERLRNEEIDTDDVIAEPPDEGEATPGDPVADPDSLSGSEIDRALADAEEEEVPRSFSHSAAWKRATNQEIHGNEPDIDMSFPGENGFLASNTLAVGGTLNAIPGFTSLCRVVASPYIGWPLAVVEGVASAFSGPGAIGRFAAIEGVVTGLSFMLMNMAFDGLVPEGPEELTGHIDMGSNLANEENSRYQGAPPVSNSEMNEQRQAYYQHLADKDRERGFVWRYVSPDNHRSVLAQVAMSGGLWSVSDLAKPFTNFSAVVNSAFSRVFTTVSASQHGLEDFHNYDIVQFTFSSDSLNSVDPVENDQEMSDIEDYQCTETEGGYQDSSGSACNIDRWNDARLMEVIIEECMENPYYEHTDNDWEYDYEQIRTADGDLEEYENEIDCSGDLTSRERSFWERVGAWRLDQDIMDNIDCLTHDDPCVDVSGEGSDSAPSEDNELVSHPDLEGPLSNGYYRLPDAPEGEYTWNEGTPPSERCGSRELVDFSYTMAVRYHQEYPEAPLVMGDLNAPGHLSHRRGVDVDLYGPNGYYSGSTPMVSADRAIQLGKWIYDTGEVKIIFYNDPQVQAAVNDYANNPNFMITAPGHWNHFHVRLKDEYRGPQSEQCA